MSDLDLGGVCPPTPECVDVCPATPDVLELKSPSPPQQQPQQEANPNAERASSPPPNCAICLGTCENKCFTDSCLHQFCFSCLLQWSKYKAECPLCKQAFKSIIHNVKSEFQYEEYMVQQPCEYYNLILSEPSRYRYSTTLQVGPSQTEAIRLLFNHPSLSAPFTPPRRQTIRHRIYNDGLYAIPLLDITGRARECSAQFYRENPAQVHRLMPFLNREAVTLISDERQVTSLMSRATNMLSEYDITSSEFRQFLNPYFRANTSHFVHEFYNFARSPYDLHGYDNNVEYSTDYNLALNTVHRSLDTSSSSSSSSSSGSSSSSSIANIGNTGIPSSTVSASGTIGQRNIDVVRIISTSSSSDSDDDVSVRRIPATSSSSTSVIVTIPSEDNAAASSSTSNEVSMVGEGDQVRVESVIKSAPPVNIDLSDTDSDECQFVKALKPPHLRTPECYSLNSDDQDSDVIFVNEEPAAEVKPNNAENGAAGNDPESSSAAISHVRFPIRINNMVNKRALMDQGWSTDDSEANEQMGCQCKLEKSEDPMLGSTSSSFHGLDGVSRRSKRLHNDRKKRKTIYEDSSMDSDVESDDTFSLRISESEDPDFTTGQAQVRATKRQVRRDSFSLESESSELYSSGNEYSVVSSANKKRNRKPEKKDALTLTIAKKSPKKKRRKTKNKKGKKKANDSVQQVTPNKEKKPKKSKRKDKVPVKQEILPTIENLLDMPGPSTQFYDSLFEIDDNLRGADEFKDSSSTNKLEIVDPETQPDFLTNDLATTTQNEDAETLTFNLQV